jgi:hypothetical protein
MNTTDKKIAEVLAKFGEPMAGNIWRVQGTAVIYHKTLERIAAQANIQFGSPHVIRAEKDECVLWVEGWIDHDKGETSPMAKRLEWSFGEACINQNYRVSGKQAAYPYAMAEKRAKDRVILKLIELSGLVYSEEEADEFKQGRPSQTEFSPSSQDSQQGSETQEESSEERIVRELKDKIKEKKTINAVTDLMLHADTQRALADMADSVRDDVRDYAAKRLTELGWQPKKTRAA